MLVINEDITISEQEINIDQIRASGPGGQNVNKVASAVHLRFPIHESSLPERVKQRLLTLPDRRISSDGVVVIKAQQHRTLEQNRQDALRRLRLLIMSAVHEKRCVAPSRFLRRHVGGGWREKQRDHCLNSPAVKSPHLISHPAGAHPHLLSYPGYRPRNRTTVVGGGNHTMGLVAR